jgi:hypothetical protein
MQDRGLEQIQELINERDENVSKNTDEELEGRGTREMLYL